MEKKKFYRHGRNYYLLGQDKEGTNYWLEEESWYCGWYYGAGYIETFTNNKNPHLSKDIRSHQHFDSLFLQGPKCARDMFKDFFVKTPLTDEEIWELVDYMKTYYTLRSVAELFKHGYSWQTGRAKIDELQNQAQEDLVNKVWLPEVFKRIKAILNK